MPARVYFDAADGTAYRVYDTQFKNGVTKRLPLGDASAHYRIFVPQSGPRRSHLFQRGESHAITDADLARQLKGAQYLHEGPPFDADTLTPRRAGMKPNGGTA